MTPPLPWPVECEPQRQTIITATNQTMSLIQQATNELDHAREKRTNPQLAQLHLIDAGRCIALAIGQQEIIIEAIDLARSTTITSVSRWPMTAARTRDDSLSAAQKTTTTLRQGLTLSVQASERIHDNPNLALIQSAKASRALAQAEALARYIHRIITARKS